MNKKIYLALSLSLATTSLAQAAMAPNHNADRNLAEMVDAQQERERAPDVVTLHVNEVAMSSEQGDGCPQVDTYTVDATVEEGVRGSLRKGDDIRISYRRKYYRCPGPQTRNAKILESGERHSAYLKCDGKKCELGGGAWSFHSEEDFAAEYATTSSEQEYWDEKIGDIRRTFYTEPDGKGDTHVMDRDDGTWMTRACWNSDDCIARQAYEGKLMTIVIPLPASRGGLVGDPIELSCEHTQADNVTLYRPGRDSVEFCRFADGSLTNLGMLKYQFFANRLERVYEETSIPKCLRIEAVSPPQEGMAGYHGPLNNTLTLSCLNYLGSRKEGEEILFMLRDEQGKIHTLQYGDFIGERNGIIRDIHGEGALQIYQHLYIDGDSKIVYVDLPRTP